MDSWNDFFCEYSEQEKSIVYTFVQYKSFELHEKFKLYQRIFEYVKESGEAKPRDKILTLMENLYIEVYYVQRAISFNIAKVARIESSYSHFTNKYSEFIAKVDTNTKLLRMRHQIKNLALKIEMRYII